MKEQVIKKNRPIISIVIVLVLGIAIGVILSGQKAVLPLALTSSAHAQQASRAGAPAESKVDAWYPRTETVAPGEMFVVALGTGMPTPITRAQRSSAWYVELGNGDIFLFDRGTGSVENLHAARRRPVESAFEAATHTAMASARATS